MHCIGQTIILGLICYYACSLMYLECLFALHTKHRLAYKLQHGGVYLVTMDTEFGNFTAPYLWKGNVVDLLFCWQEWLRRKKNESIIELLKQTRRVCKPRVPFLNLYRYDVSCTARQRQTTRSWQHGRHETTCWDLGRFAPAIRRFVGQGDTPDFGHTFSNRTHFRLRACDRFWLSSFQRARRVVNEKKDR